MPTRSLAIMTAAAAALLLLVAVWGDNDEPPRLSNLNPIPAAPPFQEPTPPSEPYDAVTIFDRDGKNPGSAAMPVAPGRVRQDAPAQHELGRQGMTRERLRPDLEGVDSANPETIGPSTALFSVPAFPAPFPEQDPRFSEVIRLSDDSRSDDFPAVAANPLRSEEVWVAWTSYSGRRDRIQLARRDPESGTWGTWSPMPGVSGDVWRSALAFDAEGRLWVIWAQQELFAANFDLYARWFDGHRWGPVERLTSGPEGDINHAVARGDDGTIHVVWQSFQDGQADIFYLRRDPVGWSQPVQLSTSPANDWAPALAVAGDGTVWVAWDSYDRGTYDVLLRPIRGAEPGAVREIASTAAFEARPSVAVDDDGRVWVAYEAGEYGWGKDQGLLVRLPAPGGMLNAERRVEVRVLDGDRISEPQPELVDLFPELPRIRITNSTDPMISNPQLVSDGQGRVHLLVRAMHTLGGFAQHWRPHIITMSGDGWATPALVPLSEGRLSMPCSVATAPGGDLWLVWPRDNTPGFSVFQNLPEETVIENVYCGRFDPGDTPAGARLGEPSEPVFEQRPVGHPEEAADVARVRGWRTRVAGQTVQILRGDTHRHTELSMDLRGAPDGSILDFYRYMLDAAAMDWGLISDHQNGADREYWWWLEEKLADMYHAPERYVAMFGYERSANYPFGHRNVIHAERGVLPVPFFQSITSEFRAHTGTNALQRDDTRRLYEELHRSGGVAIAHTTATTMGTDWADNDPDIEPVVEIYQGDRHNYEYRGAPLSDLEDYRWAPVREAGYVANAWAKGYRLGVIASSDHVSTHLSYAMVWAPERTREAILEAIRARRTYAATDNIVLEFWAGDRFMGSEFRAEAVPPLRIKAVGTQPVEEIVIVRNNKVVYQSGGRSREVDLAWRDTSPEPGTSYYYVRLVQSDGSVAWSSPIWIDLGG